MNAHSSSAQVLPYADHHGDGYVQLAFTLPVAYSNTAKKAAMRLLEAMGLFRPEVVHSIALTEGYTYFIAYAQCPVGVDLSELNDDIVEAFMSRGEIERFVEQQIGRKIIVIGASTGTDTHSVGIDAMLNLKGFNGEAGLEAYNCFETYNLGSQVANGDLIEKTIAVSADAILVSQTVTQQSLHIHNLTQLADMLESQGLREQILLICGGPRVSDELAKELGYDAGFSKGCYPNHVASFIARRLAVKIGAPLISTLA
ncbi:MAG TPA: OAM dimerization domain-containing protein [Paraburkholderia sp.]|uniref:lysine 5,6-aminomutase subunit beta n=1 Tax=Paraburkholderia sp. TaxID=1926495 RepID=UPI002ED1F5FD